MKQVQITMTFDTLEELSVFLQNNPGAAPTKVASAQPSATVTPITAAAPAASVVPTEVAAAPAADQTLDAAAKRSELMDKLRKLSDSAQGNTQPIADFIHGFGVQRFSDLPDDQLATFEANLQAQFGV